MSRRALTAVLPAALLAAVLGTAGLPAPAAADETAPGGQRLASGQQAAGRAPAAARTAADGPVTASFIVTGDGPLDPAVQAAVERATGELSRTVSSGVPVRVVVRTGPLPEGVLATATPVTFALRDRRGADDRTDTLYPIALANALVGRDLDPQGADVVLVLSAGAPFWTGADPAPGDRFDLTSAVLGRLAHGLGLLTTLRTQDGVGRFGVPGDRVPVPVIGDRLLVNAAAADAARSAPLLVRAQGSKELATALAAPLYWDGTAARAASAGRRPLVLAPSGGGLAPVQLPEAAAPAGSPDAALTPALGAGETARTLGPVARGMLSDIGWGVPSLPGARFTAVAPRRLLDTRTGLGQGGARRTLGPGGVLDLQVAGVAGVPADATAVVLNVTGVAPSTSTDLRVYPSPRTQETVPEVSSVNLGRGTTRASQVTVPVGRDGRVRLRNAAGTVSVLADLQGWYGAAGEDLFHPVTPVRLLDTRRRLPYTIGPGATLDLQVAGVAGVPASARAAVLGITGVGASRPTDLRAYPTPAGNAPVPVVSTVNLRPGPPVAGLAVVRLGDGGRVRIRNAAGTVAVVVDLAGWYDAASRGGLGFRPVAPQRVFDSRTTTTPRLGPGVAVDVPVTGRGGVPTTARAVVLGVTGIAASRSTDVRVYPLPSVPGPPPTISNLNLAPTQTSANAVVVATGTAGGVRLRNNAGGIAAAVDVSGWFGP